MTKGTNIRGLALGVLLEVSGGMEYSHVALRNVLEKYQYLEKQERAFLTRLVEGTLERRIWLDYVIDQFSSVKVRKQKPVIREILRLSVYQLQFMDSVPDAAVVSEAVKLAEKKGFRQLKGFVNGVLRNVARNLTELKYPPREQTLSYLSVRYSMPEWIVEDWILAYGEETVKRMLAAFYENRPTTIRVNESRTTPEELKAKLLRRGVNVSQAPYLPCALQIEGYDYLGVLPEFREGLFQVQDVSSMLAVEAAGVKPGDYCIDVCAAPGGKSLYLAEKTGEKGLVDARDLTEYKAELIRENAERLQAENIKVSVRDACVPDKASEGQADVLLADLPCSGLGVLGKKTDLKYRMSREQQQELAALQRKILSVVQAYVKPGGILIYSTCTICQAENEENVRWFLEQYPYEAVSMEDCLPEELLRELSRQQEEKPGAGLQKNTVRQGYLQLLPGVQRCDGFFIAKFRRKIGE
ncbi:MAG TPA: 16S rRNA (cytosine(967)-C(5))-methyltransferase RsmB [Candidatus Merdisoma merdipullorum]|nr:16S rRNA (cytosine(967)-C(5))-methyltransferase RsmB [Candidatus Merdisoma merdipullorum]